MSDKELFQLIDKVHQGAASDEELSVYTNYLNAITSGEQEWDVQNVGTTEEVKKELFERIMMHVKEKKRKTLSLSLSLWPRMVAAAAILLVVGAGLFFFNRYTSRHVILNSFQDLGLANNNIKPGSNKAYLVLANGKRLSLTDAANGAIAKEAGVEITKTADGQVVYTAPGDPGLRQDDGVALNTIETPRGGQYQIRLPDGSKVWLNAASKLIYPVTFTGRGQRKVELYGEAYFEIFKNKLQPFVVKSKNQEVTVLGTHFNINSYADESNAKTTLLEGSVRINGVILKPGEQATLQGNNIHVKEVDPALVIDWKNGEFRFKDESMESILRKVARWYDVEFVYQTNPKNLPAFSGSVSRFDNVSAVLTMLEETSRVKFKIEGKIITVK